MNEEGLRRANGVGKKGVEEPNSAHPPPSPFLCGPLPLPVVETVWSAILKKGDEKLPPPVPQAKPSYNRDLKSWPGRRATTTTR
ncbi:hypothetical protein Esi_0167_0008 [Ectocarpus siliculosus]|uniref:Uncharacterized protein n=1 Tax=Ectocarpus siliculosus TaxID=2880 RepID=D8LGD9_ECTSI|nr:hypothetical protein Esi_0167_0008 [Ectocarpus siliculosus]|eukprot:CBN75714.1 hypothetical protein Esi_0167_0008 [Ectocarpus siliculosus]